MLEACTKQPLHIVIRVCTCADVCLCVHPTAGSSLSTLHDEPQESRFRTNLNNNLHQHEQQGLGREMDKAAAAAASSSEERGATT